jgi:hypothetical protein
VTRLQATHGLPFFRPRGYRPVAAQSPLGRRLVAARGIGSLWRLGVQPARSLSGRWAVGHVGGRRRVIWLNPR